MTSSATPESTIDTRPRISSAASILTRSLGTSASGSEAVSDLSLTHFSGADQSRGPQRGQDIRYDIEISLEQAYAGLGTEIEVPRTERCSECNGSGAKPGTSPKKCPECEAQDKFNTSRTQASYISRELSHVRKCRGKGTIMEKPCNQCHGAGIVERNRRISVKIPQGVDTGSQLLLRGEGDAPNGSGRRGDLYVVVHVKSHQTFRREGNDLICNVDVSFSRAALGGDVQVPTLDGPANIMVPAGTQSGAIFRLRKKGMPEIRENGKGDELVVVQVKTPTNLTSHQKELVQELSREGL